MSESAGQASLSAVPLSLSNAIPKYFDLKSERSYNVLHGATEHSYGIFRASNPSSSNVSKLSTNFFRNIDTSNCMEKVHI